MASNRNTNTTVYHPPRFAIDYFTLRKIYAYAEHCDVEISGFGLRPNNGVFSELAPLLPQICSGAETEIPDSSIHHLAHSKYSARVNMWWHSHVHMQCFWSAQDEQAIATLGIGIDLLYSIVVNKRNEYKARIDIFKPLRYTFDNLDIDIVNGLDRRVIEQVKREIKSNVQTRSHVLTFKPGERDIDKKPNGNQSSTAVATNETKTEEWLKKNGYEIKNGVLVQVKNLDPQQMSLIEEAHAEVERYEKKLTELNDINHGDGEGWGYMGL